jgi:hypothetical protein
MNSLIGKWQQPEGQPFPGLWFQFDEDGTYRSEYSEMGIVSSGTYQVAGDLISIEQTQHTLGLLGKFEGRFSVENTTLKMALGNPGEKAPENLDRARIYLKA